MVAQLNCTLNKSMHDFPKLMPLTCQSKASICYYGICGGTADVPNKTGASTIPNAEDTGIGELATKEANSAVSKVLQDGPPGPSREKLLCKSIYNMLQKIVIVLLSKILRQV